MQLLWIHQRKADQDAGVDAVTLGVALIVAAKVGHFLAVDQKDRDAVPSEEDGDGKPGHAGGLHHHLQRCVGRTFACPGEEALEVGRCRVKAEDRGEKASLGIGNDGFVRSRQGQINSDGSHQPSLRGDVSPHCSRGRPSDGRRPGHVVETPYSPSLRLIRGLTLVGQPQRS